MQRRSARLSRVHFVGGGHTSLLSAAYGALFPFLATADACSLRATCREAHYYVREFPWDPTGYWSEFEEVWHPSTRVGGLPGSVDWHRYAHREAVLAKWRAVFPRARGLCFSDLHANWAPHLLALQSLDITGSAVGHCTTDAAIALLVNLRKLIMSGTALDGSCFASLPHLRYLVAGGCDNITDAAVGHLKKVETLVLYGDSNAVSDAGLARCASLRTLVCGNASGVTGAFLEALAPRLTRLLLWDCSVTDEGLRHLERAALLERADLSYSPGISDEGLAHLRGVRRVELRGCEQLTPAGIAHLGAVRALNVQGCSREVQRAARALKATRGVELL